MEEYLKILKIIEDGAKLALINLDEDLIVKHNLTIDYAVISTTKDNFNKCKTGLENNTISLGMSNYINANLFLLRQPISITGSQKVDKVFLIKTESSDTELIQLGFISSSLLDTFAELQKKKEHIGKLEKIGKYKMFTYKKEDVNIDFVNKPVAEEEQLLVIKELFEKEIENKLHVMADFQNYKKRIELQQREMSDMANKQLLNQVIDVIDDCNRALNDENHDGVQLIIDKLKYILKDQGLEETSVKIGDKFNPESMEAVATTPVQEGQEVGKVVHIDQLGYVFQTSKKVYRPSRVIISK